MKIEEAAKLMTKQYLSRVMESFTRDIAPMDEDELREFITRNSGEISKPAHVEKKLDLFDVPHSTRVLSQFVLEALINAPDCALSEKELAGAIATRETALIDEANLADALGFADENNVDILRTVLEVAFEDDEVSRDEYRLLLRLRQRLNLSRKQQRIVEAQMGVFPKPDGEPHTFSQVGDAAKGLQKRGIIFHCNRAENGPIVVLPEELQESVKSVLGIEISDKNRELLWSNLSNAHLKVILRSFGMAVSGNKEELVERLMRAEVTPSEGLDELMNSDLYDICSSLPGVKVSGSKDEKIDRIVGHFDRLVTYDVDPDADPAEEFYKYYVELAARDRENLYANDIITKDLQIEHAFEAATTYLFNEKFGIETGEFSGSDHPDGVASFKDDSLFYWDCKSKESIYTFPSSHQTQFKRYIRDAEVRVNCFMVIVPELDLEKVDTACLQLKYASQRDTDICVIRAEDLKWVAENWTDAAKKDASFDLNVFNQTGVLTRKKLEQAMKLLL